MLEWMQRHKKWLVITIWVSVIALVSAGMVGWNPSSFSFAGDNVAKVGNIKISQQEFNLAYQRILNEYSKVLGDSLDGDKAKELGLDKVALNQLIQKAQLQNFATDIGLRVTNQEVAEAIIQNESFQKDGSFDNTLYRNLLKENNLSVKFFEESVRDSLLIEKLLKLFPTSITALEQKAIGSTIQLTDTIEYKIISPAKKLQKKITPTELEDFWKQNKQNYINLPKVSLEIVTSNIKDQPYTQKDLEELYNEDKSIYLNPDGHLPSFSQVKDKVQIDYQSQLAKKEVFRLAQKLKSDHSQQEQKKIITITLDSQAPKELRESFDDLEINSLSKPFLYNKNSYAIGKVIQKTPQGIKTFQEAKKEALHDLENKLLIQESEEMAKKQLITFKGDLQEINNLNTQKISTLSPKDIQIAIRNIFSHSNTEGIITLQDKIMLYRIKKQQLPEKISDQLFGAIQSIKSQTLDRAIMDYVNKKYKVRLYSKI